MTDPSEPPEQPSDKLTAIANVEINTSDPKAHAPNRGIAFWNVNVPVADHTDTCPQFLAYAFRDVKDQRVLATPDEQYVRQSWDEVRKLIEENRLDLFKRVPSQLRLYREYCNKLVHEYGSIMKFVMDKRLRWNDLDAIAASFENPDDYKIIYNDWPYGVDEDIVHLVVWTRFELPVDPASDIGDMSVGTRQMVNDFVERTFERRCGKSSVIWFKNWGSLKSVHAIEHFHVMLLRPGLEFVRQITDGDEPLFRKVRREQHQQLPR